MINVQYKSLDFRKSSFGQKNGNLKTYWIPCLWRSLRQEYSTYLLLTSSTVCGKKCDGSAVEKPAEP